MIRLQVENITGLNTAKTFFAENLLFNMTWELYNFKNRTQVKIRVKIYFHKVSGEG